MAQNEECSQGQRRIFLIQNNKINLRKIMIENSLISHRSVYDSFSKFQRTASDHKFRTKSIRVKTVTQQIDEHIVQKIGLPVIYPAKSQHKFKPLESAKNIISSQELTPSPVKKRVQSYKIIQKNYQEELNKIGVDSQFLHECFLKKCEQTQTKFQDFKYQIFLKNLSQRLCNSKELIVNQMGFGHISLTYFLKWFIQWDGNFTQLNLSTAEELLKEQKMKIIQLLLTKDKKLMKLVLQNSSLQGSDINQIFKIINQQKILFALDISNSNSQALNRIGAYLPAFQEFFRGNFSVAIAKLDNLHVRRQGFEFICRGIELKKANPLRVLSLSSNHISGSKVCEPFCNLLRSGLTHLNLSCNPLGKQFYQNLTIIKNGTIRQLNLSETKMSSQNLYYFFQKIEECKSLLVVKLDNNDFSHHWFGKIGQKLEVNSSIQYLSLNNCQIKYFLPFFQGLVHNKYLKRLDVNHNCIDKDELMTSKIANFFLHNKFLQQFRCKFCNLDEPQLTKIFQGLRSNKTLKIIDISENALQDLAATDILKMLQQNMTVQYIGIQKLQISQQMKKRIEMKLKQNGSLRQKKNFVQLKHQTKTLKQRDSYSWQDLAHYQKELYQLQSNKTRIEQKTQYLQEVLKKKKTNLTAQIKKYRDQTTSIDKQLMTNLRISNDKVNNAKIMCSQYQSKQEQMRQNIQKQKQKIRQLQINIKQANQKNKVRENQLEDKLRNHKYLQRRKSKNHQLVDPSPKKYSIYGNPSK